MFSPIVKPLAYIFLVVNLSVATAGFMSWTARRVLPPEPPRIRTFPNCAEYFFDKNGDFRWVPVDGKGLGYVSFQDTDMECGE